MPDQQQGRAVACPHITEDTRYQVLKILEQNPQISQRKLAREMGVSLGKVNYCLKALVGKGLVKVRNFKSRANKRAYLYVITPKGVEAKAVISVRFLGRKIEEYEVLRAETENLQAEAGGGVSFCICRFGAGIQAMRAQIVRSRKFSAEFTRFNYA